MIPKRFVFPLFVVVAIAQLTVPGLMVIEQEDVLKTGVAFKFETTPIDPYDPFRGKYVVLGFKNDQIDVGEDSTWRSGDKVYVSIKNDVNGFAEISSVSNEPPTKESYFKASVDWVHKDDDKYFVYIDFPFDRFYMGEFKAQDAEDAHRDAARDSTNVTYALVYIKGGKAVLDDVLINDVSIRELNDSD